VLWIFSQQLLGMKEMYLFAAIRSCAFLFLKHCSFKSSFKIMCTNMLEIPVFVQSNQCFLSVQCTLLTYTSSTTESPFSAIHAVHFYHCQVCDPQYQLDHYSSATSSQDDRDQLLFVNSLLNYSPQSTTLS